MFKSLFGKSNRELAFESIIDLLNIASFEEKKGYIQSHQILLSSDASFVLDKMIALDTEKRDDESVRILKSHKQLLTRCKQIGISQAFKELDLLLLQNIIRDLVEAENGDQARDIILKHPEVLSDKAIELIDELIGNQSNESAKNTLRQIRTLILRCRKLGVENAFDEEVEDLQLLELATKLTSELFGAETLLEKKLVILENPDFLSDQALAAIEYMLEDDDEEWIERMGDSYETFKSQLSAFLELLRMCKQHGVKETFQMMEFGYLQKKYGRVVFDLWEKIDFKSISNFPETISTSYEVLKFLTERETPEAWSVYKTGLATALAQTPTGNRADNLEEAIYHYQQALEVIKIEVNPLFWAETVQNIANAYSARIKGDAAENIEVAIRYYQQSLEVFTKETYPKDWAMALRNLAVAVSKKKYGDPVENIETTIRYCEQVREVSILEDSLEDWVLNQNTLGLAYYHRNIGDRTENLEKSVEYFEEILNHLSIEELPELWGTVQHNLANAYSLRMLGEKSENIEKSIHHYEQALTVRTKKDFPEKWAMTNHDLATTYLDRIAGKPKENRRKAMKCLSFALEVNTSDQYPIECRETAIKLGTLAFEDKNWEVCIDAYEQALSAHMIVFQNLIGNKRKADEIKELGNVHQNLAYAYIMLENTEKAVEILEHGRATLLRETIERQRTDLNRLSALGFKNLFREYQESTTLYENLVTQLSNGDKSPSLISQIEQALKQRNSVAEKIRSDAGAEHPEYRYFLSSISIKEIKHSAKSNPIVYLCSTLNGGFALVVKSKSITLIDLPDLNERLLRRNISNYFMNYRRGSAWHDALDAMLVWLGKCVMTPVMENFNKQARIILVPGGFLGLLPLHSAIISQSKGKIKYAFEQCQITYTPNVQSLNHQNQHDRNSCQSILAVDNPNKTLIFSGYEVRSVIKHFDDSKHLLHEKAKKDSVMNSMKNACVIHLSTHGEAGWMDANQSKLLLADDNFYLSEITSMRLEETKLVVLSACETGIPDAELPDEVLSFPSALIQAGVSSVISSLWAVNEMSTAILISKFYNLWRNEDLEIAEALRQAQIWLKSSNVDDLLEFIHKDWKNFEQLNPKDNADLLILSLTLQDPEVCLFEHPYYWAGFTYSGS